MEHASAKDLIKQIESMNPADDLYDAKVKVLGEYIAHHVVEEHKEMFPKCRRLKIDLMSLGISSKHASRSLSQPGVQRLRERERLLRQLRRRWLASQGALDATRGAPAIDEVRWWTEERP